MRIGVIGRSEMLYNGMSALAASGHQLAFIITSRAYPEYSKKEDDFRRYADDHKIPFLLSERVNSAETAAFITAHSPHFGISLNCKVRLNRDILDCFPRGIVNAHFGDLPLYRGNAVINWAIINGEPKVVCTLHYMNEEIDAGPILLKKDFPLTNNTYYGEIYSQIADALPGLFVTTLSGIEAGTIIPKPQPSDPSLCSRCYPRAPSDSKLDFSLSAQTLARLVRASSEPLSGAFTYFKNQKLTIWRASARPLEYTCFGIPGSVIRRNKVDGTVGVLAGDGELVLEQVEWASCGRCKPVELLKGLRDRLGFDYRKAICLL